MKIETIGVMSPGDMGQAVAQQLKNGGFKVCTALDQRSARSKALAQQAGLTDLGTIAKLIENCDVILSIMNPGSALDFAGDVAHAMAASKRRPLFVDCNAIAPTTLQAINGKISAAGGRCADASIIGPPPRGNAKMWLYASGAEAGELEQLATPQITVRVDYAAAALYGVPTPQILTTLQSLVEGEKVTQIVEGVKWRVI